MPSEALPAAPVRRLLALLLALVFATTVAEAQKPKVGRKYFEDAHHGYRFRHPEDWKVLPVRPHEKDAGFTVKLNGPDLQTKLPEANRVVPVTAELFVIRLAPGDDRPVTGEESGGLRGRVAKSSGERPDISQIISERLSGLRDFDPENPIEDEDKKFKGLTADHRTWKAFTGNFDILLDTWTFSLSDADIALVFLLPEQHEKKWLRVFEKSARTFEEMERTAALAEASSTDYEGLLAYHRDEASRTEGWRVLPTPSKRYIIKTSSEDEDFLEEVIERLENSRDLFEKEWPIEGSFDEISVARVCKSIDEYTDYGGPRGTGGYFNPSSTELVLFDWKDLDRRMTFAVMTHEAFHQYCFFLFDQAEAHRWFDEGHGDYYGGAEFKRNRVTIEKQMPAYLNRYDIVRRLVRENDFVPLEKHLNFSHPQWQSKGVASYGQSWSLIYMLREGMLGNVNRRYWDASYAEILPNYVAALHAGFQRAFQEELAKRVKDAEEDGRELSEEDRKINRFDIDDDVKKEIWAEATEASWGQIDLAEFEAKWLEYVKEDL